MTLSVLLDSQRQPSAFNWSGPVATETLARWVAQHQRRFVPDELIVLWTKVGGGDLFESETILAPNAESTGDDIDAENERLLSLGMSSCLLAFHVGLCVSAVDQATREIVQLDHESLAERCRFESFDEWYCLLLRAEYGSRYSLGPVAGR